MKISGDLVYLSKREMEVLRRAFWEVITNGRKLTTHI